MSALEQSLAALCAEHKLESLSITIFTPADLGRSWFQVGAQWLDLGRRHCGTGDRPTSIAQALGNAIADMHAKRGTADPVALADGPLVSEVA